MQGGKTAIVVASSFTKNTLRTGKYIAKILNADLFDLKKTPVVDISGYDRIYLGTGVHAGKPYQDMTKFVNSHRSEFSRKDTKLFIRCIFEGQRAEKQAANIASTLDIDNYIYMSGKTETNDSGMELKLDYFIGKLVAQ